MGKKSSENSFKVFVSDIIGEVSAAVHEPAHMKVMMTLAHGAGTDMHHSFMKDLSVLLGEYKVGTLRFNFPYTEKGRKMPDKIPVASAAIQSVLRAAHDRYPGLPVVGSGKSFGGRMTSHALSDEHLDFVKAIVFFGFPLHRPGAPSTERAEHLSKVKVPMLFLQGSNDALAQMDLMEKVCSGLTLATLEKFEGVDHSFNRGKQTTMKDLAQRTGQWLDRILSNTV